MSPFFFTMKLLPIKRLELRAKANPRRLSALERADMAAAAVAATESTQCSSGGPWASTGRQRIEDLPTVVEIKCSL